MKKIGLGLDYNNICKDYNTVYLDRDNNDRETVKCMKSVMDWFNKLLSELMQTFNYNIYRMNQNTALELKEIVQKRFFFYSLEKEMILQTFILQTEAISFDSPAHWAKNTENTLLIKNDDEGEGVYFYFNEDSEVHKWLLEKLREHSLDEVPFEEA
ncbi:MAG: Unknown protein [uncultured Sulfurovum sp.]|uniref:Uncharacterized protein n=1 Tax=uncultured Sulfurovum sp. TaxID=269237 RepID=A0A6S6SG46_9BACT|nr:MAG: Unknown protein [uncultured Sulfurovum sp.]